jgi:hypothetical protein
MVRLAVLSFKPIGTKISVNDNKISFCEPGFFQGPLRWTKGDNREDLHNLFYPIKKAMLWRDKSNKLIREIFEMSIDGLDILKLAYNNNSMITHSVDHYKTFIQEKLVDDNDRPSTGDTEDENTIHKALKNLWNNNEITIINNILIEMKDNRDDDLLALIKAIESILITKELKVKKIIIENTTILE